MILYRSVGLEELALIYDSDMKTFPARLPQQPIFYPVLDLEYARQVASDWNAKNGQFAGYVTHFKVDDQYISKFETHTVGGSQHQELWIPAEGMEEFNQHIIGRIKVVEAYFGDAFQGLIPDKFGLQEKNVVEQFTLLTNSYIYKRMDFYLEIKRNHKAVFLNYPFWQKYNFKNPVLKEKILQAIKEAWFTSFPQIPLVTSVHEEPRPVEQSDVDAFIDPADDEIAPENQSDSNSFVEPFHEDVPPVKKTESTSLIHPVDKKFTPVERNDSIPPPKPVHEDIPPIKENSSPFFVRPVRRDIPGEKTDSHFLGRSVRKDITPVRTTVPNHEKQIDSHLVLGVKLGLDGKYYEAVEELSKAVESDPEDVFAQTSLGVAFHRLGEEERALSCYEAALQVNPKFAEAHYFRANLLYEHGDLREAIAGYTTAIGLEPRLIEAHQNDIVQDRLTDYTTLPAEIYRIAKPAYRILDLTKSLETNPRQANLYKERAAEFARLGNHEQAVADYSASLEIQPDDAGVLHFRGLAYEQLGEHDRALADFQQAIAINPQLSDVYIHRGVTLGKAGNFRQSVSSLNEGIRLAPKNPVGYFNRGITYFQQGDLERAIDDFSNVIRLSPEDDAAYYWRGISNEEAGRQRDAIADYKQYLTLSQDTRAREEIEQRLSQWKEGKADRAGSRDVIPVDKRKADQVESKKPDPRPDIHDLIAVFGERALNSMWFGENVNCQGEKAEELYGFTDEHRPIPGRELLKITSGIQQTIEGDFTAFDPNTDSHWLLIRAWGGSGFYMEIDDPESGELLKSQFPEVEEVEGASPPYESLFLHI